MNPQDPLAALHPLRQPEAIGSWPAVGWWLLLALVLTALLAAALWLRRRRRASAYRRHGVLQLEQLYQAYELHRDGNRLLAEVNALLKSVALVAYPHTDIAAQYGSNWVAFLHAQADGVAFPPGFEQAPYQPDANIDVAALERAARHWIKHHRVAR